MRGPDAEQTGADDGVSRDTVEIRMEIEEVRADMADTVEAIEEKLRPSAVVARAKERVKDAAAARVQAFTDAAGDTVRAAGSAAQRAAARTRDNAGGMMGMMRDNPVPAALIAVGAGWLLANARRGDRGEHDDIGEEYWRELRTHSAARRGFDMSSVRRSGHEVQSQLHRMTSENPLLVGAGALLIGAAFGLALPETERENELMGDARDSLVDRAQQVASDAAGRLKEQATGVADAAGRVADSLAPGTQG
jgi:hypothetical protein